MIEVKVTSLTETHEAAKSVAESVQPGDLILLVGDLGAGKTVLAQGFGKALESMKLIIVRHLPLLGSTREQCRYIIWMFIG